jgi:hypothetical protein
MAVTLNGVPLNDNLILRGHEERPLAMINVAPTLGGADVIQGLQLNASVPMELVALGGAKKQGWFCSFQIELINAMMSSISPVVLNYHGVDYEVIVTDRQLEEWHTWEPPNDNKRFSGSIFLRGV